VKGGKCDAGGGKRLGEGVEIAAFSVVPAFSVKSKRVDYKVQLS